MTIIVYSKPACPQCIATKITLAGKGVDFEYRDISKDETAAIDAQRLTVEKGFRSMPIVVTDTDAWCGNNPDKLNALISALS